MRDGMKEVPTPVDDCHLGSCGYGEGLPLGADGYDPATAALWQATQVERQNLVKLGIKQMDIGVILERDDPTAVMSGNGEAQPVAKATLGEFLNVEGLSEVHAPCTSGLVGLGFQWTATGPRTGTAPGLLRRL
jgi:hypothetical protein